MLRELARNQLLNKTRIILDNLHPLLCLFLLTISNDMFVQFRSSCIHLVADEVFMRTIMCKGCILIIILRVRIILVFFLTYKRQSSDSCFSREWTALWARTEIVLLYRKSQKIWTSQNMMKIIQQIKICIKISKYDAKP